MKIREYKEQTDEMIRRFESGEACGLREFDAIEFRTDDLIMWERVGLTLDDDVPESPKRILMPSFELKDE